MKMAACRSPANQRINAMSQATTIGLDRTDEEILNADVSDDALEAAGLGKEQAVPPTAPFAIICIPFAD
jgi:hypothetical protein